MRAVIGVVAVERVDLVPDPVAQRGAVLLARLGTQAELVGGAGLEAMEELLKNYKEGIKSLQARKDELKRLLAEEDD